MANGAGMRRHTGESGQAVIAVTIIVSLVLLVLLTMITQTQLGNRLVGRQLTYQGQAANAAQAGLVDALSWFRKQAIQPVPTFQPLVNASANPPINDTEDTSIGIVRTYQVSGPGRLMGRYEVRIGVPLTSTAPNAGSGVLDVTTQKGRTGPGSVWQLESVGTIWVQNDPNLPNSSYNQSPNTILSQQTFRTEIQRMSLNLPDGGAALFSANCDNVKIDTKTKIQGGPGIGVSCRPGSGSGITNNGVITGATNTKTNSVAPYTIQAVFSVSQQELLGLADVNVTQTKDLPSPLPAMSLIVINGDATFGPKTVLPPITPLTGSGILVVFGNLTIQADPSNVWNGVIYVTGNLNINEPMAVSGSIIAANSLGSASIAVNSGSDISEVDYDTAMISQINTQMGAYRFSRSKYWIGK
jgi:hypothetical protein